MLTSLTNLFIELLNYNGCPNFQLSPPEKLTETVGICIYINTILSSNQGGNDQNQNNSQINHWKFNFSPLTSSPPILQPTLKLSLTIGASFTLKLGINWAKPPTFYTTHIHTKINIKNNNSTQKNFRARSLKSRGRRTKKHTFIFFISITFKIQQVPR